MSGIFTTIRVVSGRAWFLQDHFARLGREVEGIVEAAAGIEDARVRVTLLDGEPPLIEASAYVSPAAAWVLQPVEVTPDDSVRRKTVARAMYDEARRTAGDADEALLVDPDGRLLECTIANIFLVADGALRTPAARLPLLPGIARARVLAAAAELGLAAREESLTLDDARRAEACFCTNALMIAQSIVEIRGVKRYESGDWADRLAKSVRSKGV